MASAAPAHPVRLELDAPLEVANWRPLVHWLLAIPQLIVSNVLSRILGLLAAISWFIILFTGRIPRELFGFMAMTLRYEWRVNSYAFWLREPYPPFEFGSTTDDPGTDPAQLSIEYPEELSRGLIFVKWLLLVPHYIVFAFLAIGAVVVVIVAWFAVLFTGRWPEGMRRYVVGVARWGYRVEAYFFLMTDVYPPFSLQ